MTGVRVPAETVGAWRDLVDEASIEWFGKLAYMSFLLGPFAPERAKHWDQLSEHQREWFRASAQAALAETDDG
ncbi:MAG: hypothetical protein ACK4X1_10275 [Terricaulis sp.]